MSAHPLSRIEELFYLEVGSGIEISLDGFERKALDHYSQRRLRGCHVYEFDGLGVPSGLILTLGGPASAGVRIRQMIQRFEPLLQHVQGTLQADYPGIPCPPRLHPTVQCRRRGGVLYRLSVPPVGPGGNLAAHVRELEIENLLGQADSILVAGSQYANGDPRDTLYHLRCLVKRTQPLYFFDYSVITASLDPLPKGMRDQASAVFGLVADRFSLSSVWRARVSPLRRRHEE
jgi:hypothetical protein